MSTTTLSNDINYDDERLQAVENEKNDALSEIENTYQGMIDESDSFYKKQIEASKKWADKQSQLQQEQTDFTIEQIEQQKEQAHKDYVKEQSGAYKDWQKQSDKYGINAEQMASSGMVNTGFSESSQVAMYNQYQNRVATAREVFYRSILTYDNNMKEARLQNSSILAEIAYKALVEQNQLALEGFQYKNGLILEKANKKIEVENIYSDMWQDVLKQINAENAKNGENGQSGGSNIIDEDSTNSPPPIPFPTDIESIVNMFKNSKDITDNMESIIALGIPLPSASKLAEMVADGKVIFYEKNGQRYYMWHPDYATKLRK